MNELIIIRGLPGSGKTTLAHKFMRLGFLHTEADMFFGTPYVFDKEKLSEAHDWCQARVKQALKSGFNVVVSNTFSRKWEMRPYLNMNALHTVLTCEGNYGNIHDVPEEVVNQMRARWEY